jgi:hypothetical protein
MQRLIAVAASYGKGRAIVREVGDHAFVVLRIPSGCAKQGVKLGIREFLESLETNGIGSHDGDANGPTGWTCVDFEEKSWRK